MHRRAMAVAILMGFALASCSSGSASPFFVRASGPMPAISGATLEGTSFGQADYAGKVVVVNFWNYDCPPCRQEQPILEADWTALLTRGVSFVGVMYVGGIPAWPDDRAAARAYLRQLRVTYPTIVDQNSSIARGFGIQGIPTTVIADRTGQLRFRILGRVRPGQLRTLIGQLETGS